MCAHSHRHHRLTDPDTLFLTHKDAHTQTQAYAHTPLVSVSQVVQNCGKMNLLDKLMKKLKARGHRVLVFSQMTKVCDSIYFVFRMFC